MIIVLSLTDMNTTNPNPNPVLNYLHELTPMGWMIIIVFAGLIILAAYSQLRKRRSTEK